MKFLDTSIQFMIDGDPISKDYPPITHIIVKSGINFSYRPILDPTRVKALYPDLAGLEEEVGETADVITFQLDGTDVVGEIAFLATAISLDSLKLKGEKIANPAGVARNYVIDVDMNSDDVHMLRSIRPFVTWRSETYELTYVVARDELEGNEKFFSESKLWVGKEEFDLLTFRKEDLPVIRYRFDY